MTSKFFSHERIENQRLKRSQESQEILQISKAPMSEKGYFHAASCNLMQLRPKPRGCKSAASPSTRRFDSARPRQNAYNCLQPDLSFLANATGSKATNTHCGMRFLLAAWHRWGVAQAGPAAIRINLKERGFSKPTFLTSSATGGKSDPLAPIAFWRNAPK